MQSKEYKKYPSGSRNQRQWPELWWQCAYVMVAVGSQRAPSHGL